ncbi:hypothetical protein KSP40_PGU009555 [Platanthera guangdongensis]|uniref:Uncharacterized protein n=1 Tax=Platanthera guangdongensis TaxID=2320717 RepID=A0ABR2LNI1_9ASPA
MLICDVVLSIVPLPRDSLRCRPWWKSSTAAPASISINVLIPETYSKSNLGEEKTCLISMREAALQIEDLLDKLSVPLTGEELDVIQKLYHQAMKLEIDFFLAQPIVQPCVVPLSRLHNSENHLFIFSDFDLTCTVLDSSAILAEIAIIKAAKSFDLPGTDSPVNQMTSSELRDYWRGLSSQYTEEYEQCIENLLPAEVADTFVLDDIYERLQQLSDFEKKANSRVIQSGVLKGMNVDDIKRAGELLKLHDGCSDFFQKTVGLKERLHTDIHILSYCWCADLIRSAFSSGPNASREGLGCGVLGLDSRSGLGAGRGLPGGNL